MKKRKSAKDKETGSTLLDDFYRPFDEWLKNRGPALIAARGTKKQREESYRQMQEFIKAAVACYAVPLDPEIEKLFRERPLRTLFASEKKSKKNSQEETVTT